MISTRISPRSLASSADSGSSNRKTTRVAHRGAAERDALPLASGKLMRTPVEQVADAQQLGRGAHALVDLLARATLAMRSGKAMFS